MSLLDGIMIIESPYLEPGSWGYVMGSMIVTPNARRLAANVHNLGIRRNGKLDLLPGKVADEPATAAPPPSP